MGKSFKSKSEEPQPQYHALVVDSGPIIKHTGFSNLFGKAHHYYTVPAVLDEIRDAKARSHLEQWPMELHLKEPSPESIQRVIAFAKQTGDYASLSKVDLQVLALCIDLEQEGCRTLDHVRTTPKRKIGLGNLQALNHHNTSNNNNNNSNNTKGGDESKSNEPKEGGTNDNDNDEDVDIEYDEEEEDGEDEEGTIEQKEDPSTLSSSVEESQESVLSVPIPTKPAAPKSWAALVHPSTASSATMADSNGNVNVSFGSLQISSSAAPTTSVDAGQFDDADDDEGKKTSDGQDDSQSDFPSLAMAAMVPYEGSDDEEDDQEDGQPAVRQAEPQFVKPTYEELEAKKKEALKPISKSGKHYNSFRKYGKLMKPAPPKPKTKATAATLEPLMNIAKGEDDTHKSLQSRIIGGGMTSGETMKAEDDDGEGWITSTSEISAMKANGGRLDPAKGNEPGQATKGPVGPPNSQRTACTTTDFAMQNVLLQMGMHLLSVDGMQVRRLKSWVTRCGACFKIHTDAEFKGMKRLFCSHCGSDMMQRIAASVDGKTGRLKLHLSKRYKHNLRGTKYSLPKAGSGNRFQGDLLLREDQLLTGAWNQKVKMRSGGQSRAHAQSIFGADIASNVGCNASALNADDVRAGFGRRNPNSAKGRERRGKKKKSDDRACGLRRY
jgi:RNA-binding protein NOB1